MQVLRQILTLVILLAGITPTQAEDFPLVGHPGQRHGVIFPGERSDIFEYVLERKEGRSFWTPSAEDVELAESKLAGYMESELRAAKNEYWRKKFKQIMDDIDQGFRQYAGYVEGGRKILLINRTIEEFNQSMPVVFDGGADYWTLIFDMQTQEFIILNINGDA